MDHGHHCCTLISITMWTFPNQRSISAPLVLSILVLILLATVSAGLPALWLTRSALKRLAWSQLSSTEHAPRSLVDAELLRIDASLSLLRERSTLRSPA